MSTLRPDHIGAYTIDGKTEFYAARRAELDRSGVQMARWLRTFGFDPGRYILTVSVTQEIVQFAPFEYAIQILGLFGTNADLSPYDAGRIESLARQFDPAAICGVGKQAIDGLAMMGHDPQSVFEGRTVWARPDAYEAIAALNGIDARRTVLLGPALALECAAGGLHVDSREWQLDVEADQLLISSRLERVEPLLRLNTGISGSIDATPCACGSSDHVICLM